MLADLMYDFLVNSDKKGDECDGLLIIDNDYKEKKKITVYDNIILEEDRKKGSLSFKIYSLFLRMNGGPFFAFILLMSFILQLISILYIFLFLL